MRRHLIHLIAALLLVLLVFADERARNQDEGRKATLVKGQVEEQQQVLDVDVPPEIGPDGESLTLRCRQVSSTTLRVMVLESGLHRYSIPAWRSFSSAHISVRAVGGGAPDPAGDAAEARRSFGQEARRGWADDLD